MKKLLLFNRRIIKSAMPTMFLLGCLIAMVAGISIIRSNPLEIDLTEYPKWTGYLCYYVGIILLFAFFVDIVLRPLIGIFKLRKKKSTLQDRIKQIEQSR